MRTPDYKFDVALSFAGSDREFVAAIAQELHERAVRVFYDENEVAEMWGEDGVEYFTRVFLREARYAVVFVSEHYAEQLWTRVERRAALARGMSQSEAYLLPIRLDDTELDGLLPTTIYVDARAHKQSSIVDLIVAKLSRSEIRPEPEPVQFRQVPHSRCGINELRSTRPKFWEQFLYAAVLRVGMSDLENKYRDHTMGIRNRRAVAVPQDDLLDFVQDANSDMLRICENFNALFAPGRLDAAFGLPGEPGDAPAIEHLASRQLACYEELLDWASDMRSASVRGEYGARAVQLLAASADGSIVSFRQFVGTLVTELDTAVERSEKGEQVTIELSVTLSLPDGLADELIELVRRAVKYD